MKALRLAAWRSEPVLAEVPVPEPGPGQVMVQVAAAGVCHSDLHLARDVDAGALPWTPPFTLGHENTGWVHTLGEGVTGLEVGRPVAVVGAWGCGVCGRCRAGLETSCERPDLAPVPGGGCGLGMDGGMAELLLVPAARHLVPVPDGLDVVDAAPLTDAGLTSYHAVRRSLAKLGPGSTALVIGVGGLGHLGVQVLHAVTAARVLAVDARASAREDAVTLGADLALSPSPDLAAQVRAVTPDGHGVDVVLDFVGTDDTLALASAVVRRMGDVTIIGIAGGTLPVSFSRPPHEASVQTSYWGNRQELVEVLDLAARGLLRARTTRYSLDDAPQAYLDLQHGVVRGRAVVVPNDRFTGGGSTLSG